MFGIAVKQADPIKPVDGTKCLQKLCKAALAVQVLSVNGGVLRNQNQLPHTVLRQRARLLHDRFHPAAAQVAANARDGAIGTAIVAAVRNAQIGEKVRRRLQPFAVKLPTAAVGERANARAAHHAAYGLHNVAVGAQSQNRIALRHFLRHLLLIPLRHAAGDDDLLNLPLLFEPGKLQNVFDRLFLCVLDKAAGVDDHHIGKAAFRDDLHARIPQRREHQLRIHLIFRASERHHRNPYCHTM